MNIRKIRIICEEAYAESIWCKQLLGGVIREAKKRRLPCEQSVQAKEASLEDAVCLIGMSNAWLEEMISGCNAMGHTPVVLSNQFCKKQIGKYHYLCPDMLRAAGSLKAALQKANRKNIALYGGNLSVDLDKNRVDIFSALVQKRSDIYSNTGNLENCFRSFFPKAAQYDTVLCVNGYAAISLVKKLEKENADLLKKLVIVSFEEVLKHSKYNQWISLVDLNLEDYGRAALMMLEIASGENDISSMTVEMECKVEKIPVKDADEKSEESIENCMMFEDPEIIHMAKIEQLLRDADDMDHHIIAMLLSNAKYGEIADSCYMTEGNVKYRVKKYMGICGCKTKKELLELLQEYLQ